MKIMIIGNGFDLNLGLKTSYGDFIASKNFCKLTNEGNLLAQYLSLKSNLNNWVDIEKEITNFSKVNDDEFIFVEKYFIELKSALVDYLREAQSDVINEKSKAFEMVKNEIETTDFIFNFNYTDSVFRIAKILGIDDDLKSKHSYVHGSIENNNIIFGVQDDADIHSSHIFLKKAYSINFGKSDIGKFLTSGHDLILFGHSLGITDSSYFGFYIYSLRSPSKSSELKFYYYGETGYYELMQAIDQYSKNNLTEFKNNNKFIPIDSSEDSI